MKDRRLISVLVLGSVSVGASLAVRHFRSPPPSFVSSANARLPAIPDLSRWPRAMQDHVARTTKAAANPKDSVPALGELAQLYFSNGFTAEAIQVLRILIEADAANARWPYLLGYLEERVDHRETALGLYASAVRLAPHYAPALIHQANLLALSGQAELAKKTFNQCLTISPPDPRASYGLAKLDLVHDGEATAVARLRQIVKQHPHFQDAHFMLAELLEKAGNEAAEHRAFLASGQGAAPDLDPFVDGAYQYCYNTHRLQVLGEFRNTAQAYAMALPYLQRAVSIDPKDPEIQDALARTLIGLSRLDEAEAKLRRALLDSGPNDLLSIRLSNVLLTWKKNDQAVAVLLEAEKSSSNPAAIGNALGMAYMTLERLPEAIAAFESAIKSDPILPEAQFNLARCYLQSGKPALARSWAEQALKLRPNAPEGLATLIFAALQMNDIEVATVNAQAFVHSGNNVVEYRALLTATFLRAGNLAAERGEHAKAEKFYREGLSANESDGQFHGALGMLFGKLHRYAEAKNEFETFVRLEPRNPLGYLLLGSLFDSEKRNNDARAVWKTGLDRAMEANDVARANQLRKLLEK